MTNNDLQWLAGVLEGEGCFTTTVQRGKYKGKSYEYVYPCIQLNMTDEDVVRRAAGLLKVKYHRVSQSPNKDTFQFRLQGQRAILMMKGLKLLMGERRQMRIAEILSTADSKATQKIHRQRRAAELRRGGMKLSAIAADLGLKSHSSALRLIEQGEKLLAA